MEATDSRSTPTDTQSTGAQEKSSASNPRQKRDLTWRYVTEASTAEGRKTLICGFCNTAFRGGGINRMKQHLAGAKGNVVSCKKVTPDVRFLLQGSLKENSEKAKEKRGVLEDDENPFGPSVNQFDGDEVEEVTLPPAQTMGIQGESHQGGQPTSSKRKSLKRPATTTLGTFFKSGMLDPSQPTIKACMQSKEKWHDTDLAIALWFYDACIPLNACNSPMFPIAMSKIASMGHGYTGPTYHALRVTLLKDAKKQVELIVDSFRSKWVETGCTIMGDGWKDGRQRPLVNFLVYCPSGISFIKSVDISSIESNAENLCNLFAEIVEMVGVKNVVHMVTDNAANYKASGALLCERYPTITWSPCAAHCINLIMKDICEMPHVHDLAVLASKVTCYVYNNKWPLNWMRQRQGWKEIIRPGDTRFATTFIALKSLFDHKDDLQAMVTSQEFKKFLKKEKIKEVKQIVLDERFWNNCMIVVRIGSPLIRLLRICDSDEKPAMGYVYEGMYRVRKGIKELFKKKKTLYQPYIDIINARWDKLLRKSLHAAAYWLNPAFQYDKESFCQKPEVLNGLLDIIDNKVESGKSKMYQEIAIYRERQKSFSRQTALTICRTTPPGNFQILLICCACLDRLILLLHLMTNNDIYYLNFC